MRRLYLLLMVILVICVPFFTSCAAGNALVKTTNSALEECGTLPVYEEPVCPTKVENETPAQAEQRESCVNSVIITKAGYLTKLHDYFICVQSIFAAEQGKLISKSDNSGTDMRMNDPSEAVPLYSCARASENTSSSYVYINILNDTTFYDFEGA